MQKINILFIIIIIIIVLLIIYFTSLKKESFSNLEKATEIYNKTYEDMKNKKITYDTFKINIPSGNAIMYNDLKQLYKTHQYTPENITNLL